MKQSEILNLRNLFALLGWEHTPSQIKNDFGKQLESVKEGFLKIKPHIEDLAIKFDEKEIDLEDVAKELENRFNAKVSVDDVKHLLLINSIFR